MCQRTCPECGSPDHFEGFGICGIYILCEGCGTQLAQRFDEAAAPTDVLDTVAYAAERTWVLPGAEAQAPSDDVQSKIKAHLNSAQTHDVAGIQTQ